MIRILRIGHFLSLLHCKTRIIVAGDGRYYNDESMQIICRVLAANGVTNIWIPTSGIMSTPAVSAAIRTKSEGRCDGGIVLTASHNPGGPGEDFGIKYNLNYGQPAGEDFTDEVRFYLHFFVTGEYRTIFASGLTLLYFCLCS
jgi:phosphoglucomutase